MSPNIRYLLLISLAVTIAIVIAGPVVDWFDAVADMLQTSNANQTELR